MSDDALKLVRYKILFTRRDYEVAFPEREDLVAEDMDPASFAAWKVAEFIQMLNNEGIAVPGRWRELGYPPASTETKGRFFHEDGRLKDLPEADKQYVRVHYEVVARHPRESWAQEQNNTLVESSSRLRDLEEGLNRSMDDGRRESALPVALDAFEMARERVDPHIHRTPLLTSRTLSERTGFDVRLKAEMFQRTGSYKIRGPLNKIPLLTEDERRRGVICSSAGNHAQGVALAAKIHGIKAVVVMAENATPSKVAATLGYGAEVVRHGTIWDEANDRARELARERGYTYIHPFDDLQLITGQGTLGLEIVRDWPEVDVVVVPIGGGGLISGVSMAVKSVKPSVRVIGVESSGAPGMRDSVAKGMVVTLDRVDCIIDGLRVKRVGETTFEVVRRYVDEIVTLPDERIFEAMIWVMSRAKLVVEGAAAAPVAALIANVISAPKGSKVACVLSGGNVNLDQIRGLRWN